MKITNHPYIIIETANTHGGDFDYLIELILAFSEYGENFGIKFQPFHYDGIALPDYSAYDIYKILFFSKEQWKKAIKHANKTKHVWLDIFDWYGIEVLRENIKNIHGIKLQSSVLENHEVFDSLKKIDLSGTRLIVNVAARPVYSIKKIINKTETLLNPQEVLLEFGFQSYPTILGDSGLSKILPLKKRFKNRLVFADHVDGKSDDAITLPLVAFTCGVEVIEKHVMLENKKTSFDYYSSLTPARFREMITQLDLYSGLFKMPFINEKERNYLEKTLMIPVLNKDKKEGSIINLSKDLVFRRTNQKGLGFEDILKMQGKLCVLANAKKAGESLNSGDFRKARIGSIIACRMKSNRLPQKALADINGFHAVELCIKNTLKIKNIHSVTLATSYLREDSVLKDYCYSTKAKFFQGDPIDVVKRFIEVAEKENLDVIVRQTADNVFMFDEIFQILLKEHFAKGADYTSAKDAALGTNFEIFDLNALKLIKKHFPKADYSEYMTWYFRNNPEYFTINLVELPDNFIRDYRLTLDYPEDLKMFNSLLKNVPGGNEATLPVIFNFLDNNPKIASINQGMNVVYKQDKSLIDTLNKVTKIKVNYN